MSNVIDFLQRLGQDADLRHAPRMELELALAEAGIDPALREALLGSDQRKLEDLLGANTNVCAMIAPGKTGFHFTAGDMLELREQVEWCSRNLPQVRALRSNARAAFEASYTGAANIEMLLAIYRNAANRKQS